MKKRAEAIFNAEVKNVFLANNEKEARLALNNLAKLADLLDSAGAEADADLIDNFIKEAGGFWDALFGAGAGALTTKDEEGRFFGGNLIEAIKTKDFSKVIDKKNMAKVLTHAIAGGVIAYVTGRLMDLLTQKVPGFKLLRNAPVTKFAIEGAVSYAVYNSNFVEMLLDGATQQLGKIFGIEMKKEQVPQQQQKPVPAQPVAQPEQKKDENSNTAVFNIAASLKDE